MAPFKCISPHYPSAAAAAAAVVDGDDECIKDAIAVPRHSINTIAAVNSFRDGGEILSTEAANCVH